MDFEHTPKVNEMQARLLAFMDEHIYPNEARFFEEIADNRAKGNAWVPTKIVEELKPLARKAGLWNLFLPKSTRAPQGLSNLEYAPPCPLRGRGLQLLSPRHRQHGNLGTLRQRRDQGPLDGATAAG